MTESASLILLVTGGALIAAAVAWAASYIWLRYRRGRAVLVFGPVLVGGLFAYGALSASNDYIASSVFLYPWAASSALGLGSMLLFLVPVTRRRCWCGFAAAGLLLGTFYLVVGVALAFGFRWPENPLVPWSRRGSCASVRATSDAG